MGLPTLQKTWHFAPNILVSEASDTAMRAELMYQVVRRMIGNSAGDWVVQGTGAPSAPTKFWTVVASCDSVAVATGSFNWTSGASCVWANEGSAHSWVHLRLVDFFGSGDHLEWVISLNGDAGSRNGAIGAWTTRNNGGTFTGFGTGTTTARPSSTQEVEVREDDAANATVAGWMGLDTTSVTTRRFSVLASSDGQEWRVLMFAAGNCPAIWAAGELTETPVQDDTGVAGWDFPCHSLIYSGDSDSDVTTVQNFSTSTGDDIWILGELNTTRTLGAYTLTGSLVDDQWTTRANAANAFDGSLPFMNMLLVLDNGSVRGPATMGYLKDMWWGLSQPTVTSDDLPDDASRQFVYAGHMVFPWIGDGTQLNPTA